LDDRGVVAIGESPVGLWCFGGDNDVGDNDEEMGPGDSSSLNVSHHDGSKNEPTTPDDLLDRLLVNAGAQQQFADSHDEDDDASSVQTGPSAINLDELEQPLGDDSLLVATIDGGGNEVADLSENVVCEETGAASVVEQVAGASSDRDDLGLSHGMAITNLEEEQRHHAAQQEIAIEESTSRSDEKAQSIAARPRTQVEALVGVAQRNADNNSGNHLHALDSLVQRPEWIDVIADEMRQAGMYTGASVDNVSYIVRFIVFNLEKRCRDESELRRLFKKSCSTSPSNDNNPQLLLPTPFREVVGLRSDNAAERIWNQNNRFIRQFMENERKKVDKKEEKKAATKKGPQKCSRCRQLRKGHICHSPVEGFDLVVDIGKGSFSLE
jgi:hypothetical protein